MASSRLIEAGFSPLPLEGFEVPCELEGDGFCLVAAGPDHAECDLEAVSASRSSLTGLFGPDSDWPGESLDLEQDRADLQWHVDEFVARRSFAYLAMDPARQRCLGCLYIYPTQSAGHDAEAYLWTRSDLAAILAARIEQETMRWVTGIWPFSHIAWPGRLIPFESWSLQGCRNYYDWMR